MLQVLHVMIAWGTVYFSAQHPGLDPSSFVRLSSLHPVQAGHGMED